MHNLCVFFFVQKLFSEIDLLPNFFSIQTFLLAKKFFTQIFGPKSIDTLTKLLLQIYLLGV